MSNKINTHTFFGLIALTIGYPFGGTIFILIMMPYLAYMVFQKNAIFLPALLLHCASETSATTIVFICFAILSVINFKELKILGLRNFFWILIGLFPLMFYLVWQRINLVGDYPPVAFGYIGYYLSFFAFLYGALVAKTFNRKILLTLYYTLFVVLLLYTINAMMFTRIIVAFTFLYIASLPILLKKRNTEPLLLLLSIFSFGSLFLNSGESTFTILLVSILGLLISLLYLKNKFNIILKLTGPIPFILIFVLYWYGITNYMNVSMTNQPERIDLTNFSSFSDRLSFKFFGDRAPFWAGGFQQILAYQPILPNASMPDITATMQSGNDVDVTFGSHTTFIELIRNYGLLAGGLLSYCLIYMVLMSRKVFKVSNLNIYFVPFFAMAFACTIILSLTGQFEMMPGYALLSFGVLGIAFSFSKKLNVNN